MDQDAIATITNGLASSTPGAKRRRGGKATVRSA